MKNFLALFCLALVVGCSGAKNAISGKKINQNFNKEQNDYFIIREPDSVFFTKKGQEILLKEYSKNYIVYENRFANEDDGVKDFLKQLDKSLKKSDVVDVLYSRPQPIDVKTFHWNVFAVKKEKDGSMILISNDNDLKAKEATKLFKAMFDEYSAKQKKITRSIFLPQIQYSYKGCSVKGVIFVKALHKNNNELLRGLLEIVKKPESYNGRCFEDIKYCGIQLNRIEVWPKIDEKLKRLIEKRYVKFIQKDDTFEKGLLDKRFIEKHQNGTHLKKDKSGIDKWVKTSKLHDKGYKFIYSILLNNDGVKNKTKLTKQDILSINDSYKK